MSQKIEESSSSILRHHYIHMMGVVASVILWTMIAVVGVAMIGLAVLFVACAVLPCAREIMAMIPSLAHTGPNLLIFTYLRLIIMTLLFCGAEVLMMFSLLHIVRVVRPDPQSK